MLNLLLISASIYVSSAFPCCNVHSNDASCTAEAGSRCEWLVDGDSLISASGGYRCVNQPWVECQITGICPSTPAYVIASTCAFKACKEKKEPYNVAFVIDTSVSVPKTNYYFILDFIENMVTNHMNDVSKISMSPYTSGIDGNVYRFADSANDQKNGAMKVINNERYYYRGGVTCTQSLIHQAIAEYKTTGITPNQNNILFLMSDGNGNCADNVCAEKANLDKAGIEVYIVGIGAGFNPQAVSCLVDAKSSTDHILLADFDQQSFYKTESNLRGVVCRDEYKGYIYKGVYAAMNGALFYDFGYEHGQVMFWVIIAVFIMFALVSYNRKKLCNKDGKYQPLLAKTDQVQSTV